MQTVETSVWVDAPLDRTYAVAKDNESFPEFMKDVKSLEIVERAGNRIVSDWVGLVPQFMLKVRWRQEDIWNDEAHTCEFRQLQGDYDELSGVWNFREENGGTRFDSVVNYEYNVPTLGPLVRKVIYSIVVKNMQNVLEAIKVRAEQG
ncbi:MAG: SRPBCC family protein [Fimbriimonadales bacterium]